MWAEQTLNGKYIKKIKQSSSMDSEALSLFRAFQLQLLSECTKGLWIMLLFIQAISRARSFPGPGKTLGSSFCLLPVTDTTADGHQPTGLW
jgi:hypothetical protein